MIFSRNIIAAEFDGKQLRLALVEGRSLIRKQWRLRDVLTVDDYASLSPAELAEAVAAFLRDNRVGHAPAVIALERSEVIVRRLTLPLEAESTLAKAVSYQIDSLHPFSPDEVSWDFALLGKDEERREIEVMVFIAPRRAVAEPAARLRAAGLNPVAVIPTPAALHALLAALGSARALCSGVILLWRQAQVEILAVEDGQLTLSREAAWSGGEATAAWLEGELSSVRAQMRAGDASTQLLTCGNTPAWVARETSLAISPLASFLACELQQPEGMDWQRTASLVAVAFSALERRGTARINLLPAGLRVREQRWVRVPSYALAGIVLLLGTTLAAKSWISDALYARALAGEIRRLEPAMAKVRQLDDQTRALADRIDAVEQLRRETRLKLVVLAELTRVFPPDAWIQLVQIGEETVEITGYAGAASSLLPLLEDSAYLEKVEFTSAISRGADGKELFRIRARITGARPLVQEERP